MNTFLRKICNYETCSYFIVGVLTTAVDYIVFAIINEVLKQSMGVNRASLIATVVSWVAAVAFAYISNKLVVFRNFCFEPGYLIKEAAAFFGARLLSGVIVLIFMWLAVSVLNWNEYVAKILSSAFNMIFNYVASKLFIFKK